MDKLLMCRICLVRNVSMYVVADKNLQEIYEKLTDVPFVTNDSRPMLACSFCYTKLKHCSQLQRKCLDAEELFAQMLCEDYEPDTPLIYPGKLEYFGGLTTSLMEHMGIVDEWKVEAIATDEDITDYDDNSGEDDYVNSENIDLKEEHQSACSQDYVMMKKEHENNGAPGAKQTLNIRSENLEDTITVKQEKNQLAGSKKIRTTQCRTTNPDTKCKEPTKISNVLKYIPRHIGEEPVYMCQICEKPFSQIAYMKRHLKTHIVEKPYKCVICQRGFRAKHLLNVHFRIHTGEKPYNCKFCQKRFSQSAHLRHHVLTHTGEKPYKCDACQRSFRSKTSLDGHVRLHTGERPYKCDICQRCFISRPMLRTHITLQHSEKSYKCNLCQRGFSIKSNLQKHIRRHTGERPFKCDVCQGSFIQKFALIVHMRKHTGEKPYKCDICLRSFISMTVLKNHSLTHSGEKPYKCDICQRSFNRKANVENHMLIHSDEKRYQCEICAKCFRQRSTLNSHLKVHKKEKQ